MSTPPLELIISVDILLACGNLFQGMHRPHLECRQTVQNLPNRTAPGMESDPGNWPPARIYDGPMVARGIHVLYKAGSSLPL